ncbi:MAG: hypothetical protein ACRC9F_00145, partial [Metamycoplasmataceae bacterium]
RNNLIIFFNAFSGEITSKIINNYVFIYGENNNLLGINIFDYKNEFSDIEEGYHNFSDINFAKITNKFPNEMKNYNNDSFFRIGIIHEIENHPKNENLKVLKVETRDNNELIIITNRKDLNVGNKYLFAINQAILGTGIIIKESKIMGIQSQGMLCSWKSLGINKEGIIIINELDINEEFNF